MEKKKISKKWPIAVSICWLAFIAFTYLVILVGALTCIIRSLETYIAIMNAGWPGTLCGTICCFISVFFMAAIHVLSKKAGINWLFIVAKIHLFVYIGFTLLLGVVTLTYL